MHEFNQSLRYDKRMYAADIAGSIAYAKALARVGILTDDEQRKIVDGLTAVGKEWEQGTVSRERPLQGTPWTQTRGSSRFSRTMRISILRTSGDSRSSSVLSAGNYTPAVRAMIRSPQICAYGSSERCAQWKRV